MLKNLGYDSLANQAANKLQLDASVLHSEWDAQTCAIYDSLQSNANASEESLPFFSAKFCMREEPDAQQSRVIDILTASKTSGYHFLTCDPRTGKTFTVKHLTNAFLDLGAKVCVRATT